MQFHVLLPHTFWVDDDKVAEACRRLKKTYEENALKGGPPIEELFVDEVLEELFKDEDSDIEGPDDWHIDPWNYEVDHDHPTTITLDDFDWEEWEDEDEE